ncbi:MULTISPECIES: DNA primase noncatalytic subunit PriX [Metallosphaera]|uniref:DNA primase noncatalytic subunit PriX n=1 Tax=Metallosphaera TaxID=41980 RepID=UPI001F061314|nr:DNA primase noncatalytic subunit PriX [Metallosphaera sedula]MCH1770132.1 DNA primase noncatalytic subunit PriX [Metallosphaera sedula]MCP6728034.1 DNA primase noncatalytic subunit PriX [Metallosphaera sedula]
MSRETKFTILLHYPDGSPAGKSEYEEGISRVYDEAGQFLFEVDGIFPPRPRTTSMDWIEKVLEKGLADCRKRFILYVGSRYLVNVKKLPEDDAVEKLKEFYYKSGGKIYETWIRSVVRGVKSKGLMPPSLKSLELKDRELYRAIKSVLERK